MKTSNIKFLFICLLLFLYTDRMQLFACTSFAVYSNNIYYGMNFDYPEVEMRFLITQNDVNKFFHLQFYSNGYWSSTVGMNSNGFFSSCQMLYPEVSNWHNPSDDEITIGQLFYNSLLSFDSTNTIINYFDTSDTKVIHSYGITLHDLFADKYGDAITLEVGDPDPLITEQENNFIIMTNFPNSEFVGQPYTNVQGVGADRYIAAYEYINDNIDDFDYTDGIEALHQTIQATGGYRTQCSFLFNPVDLEIYIVLKRNFDNIWRVDLENETIETFMGFDFYRIMDIGDNGILVSELEDITTSVENSYLYSQGGITEQPYPNPFTNYANIVFDLESSAYVVLEIYDAMGRKVNTLINGYLENGQHSYAWYPDAMKSGVYFSKLLIDSKTILYKLSYTKAR